MDRTLGWTEGTAWALHHGQEPPVVGEGERAQLLDAVSTATRDVARLQSEVIDIRAQVRGLAELLHGLASRVGEKERQSTK